MLTDCDTVTEVAAAVALWAVPGTGPVSWYRVPAPGTFDVVAVANDHFAYLRDSAAAAALGTPLSGSRVPLGSRHSDTAGSRSWWRVTSGRGA